MRPNEPSMRTQVREADRLAGALRQTVYRWSSIIAIIDIEPSRLEHGAIDRHRRGVNVDSTHVL